MTDAGYVAAGYAVTFAALAAYAVSIRVRARRVDPERTAPRRRS
jgi:hypothetical protein